MNIPDEYKKLFKEAIADTFYDKDVEIYNTVSEVGEELDTVIRKGDFIENIKCNVHQVSNESVQRDYGLAIEASIMITCDKTVTKIGNILVYNGKDYETKSIINSDSHTTLLVYGSDTDG